MQKHALQVTVFSSAESRKVITCRGIVCYGIVVRRVASRALTAC